MLLSAKEVAARLGVCDRTALRLMQTGVIRSLQVGPKLWRTSPQIIEAYLRLRLGASAVPVRAPLRQCRPLV